MTQQLIKTVPMEACHGVGERIHPRAKCNEKGECPVCGAVGLTMKRVSVTTSDKQ